ncbi:hypothetical protein SDC9_210491 [bioreactor metagenome]|uniref:Methyl-accepting chemotaxis protein IV n=1 Tax=bioreactor metagenome TaxID=1076179 RepID=A0A645JGA7_9ZZZZ
MALVDVVDGAGKIGEAISSISQASSEQANAINQITVGIDQISSVVQTNSATAEESAAASEELSSQSGMLNELIGAFKLKVDSHEREISNILARRAGIRIVHCLCGSDYRGAKSDRGPEPSLLCKGDYQFAGRGDACN